jgi:hypothetical protein
MYHDFLKMNEELHAAANPEHGTHHYKRYYKPEVPGRQRGIQFEIEVSGMRKIRRSLPRSGDGCTRQGGAPKER